MSERTGEPSDLWDILSTRRGRVVVKALADSDCRNGVGRPELTDRVFDHEADVGTVSKYESVRVGLHQTYLPRMKDAGMVEWDDNDVVIPTDLCLDLAEAMDEVQRKVELYRD